MQRPKWVAPDDADAMRARREAIFTRGTGMFLCPKRRDHSVAMLGEGITLYFDYLYGMACVFLVMMLLNLPALMMNSSGKRVQEEDKDPFGFVLTTMGNLGVNPELPMIDCADIDWSPNQFSNVTYETVAERGGCYDHVTNQTEISVAGTTIYLKTATALESDLDLLSCIVYTAFCWWFRLHIKKVARQTDRDQVTPADFSVRVKGLPKAATEQQIAEHFSQLYDLSKPGWRFRGHCGTSIGAVAPRKRPKVRLPGEVSEDNEMLQQLDNSVYLDHEPQPVEDFSNTRNSMYVGKWVAEVAVIRPISHVYKYADRLRAKLEEFAIVKAKLERLTVPADGEGGTEEEIAAAAALVEKAERSLAALRLSVMRATKHAAEQSDKVCLGAYVVFNEEESYLRCLEDYHSSTNCCGRMWQPSPLKFRIGSLESGFKSYPLNVSQAPEPANLAWENLDFSDNARAARRCASACVVFLLLAVSFAIVFVAGTQKAEAARKIPGLGSCATDLPATAFGSYDAAPETTSLVRNRTLDGVCGVGQYYLRWKPGGLASAPSWPARVAEEHTSYQEQLDAGAGANATKPALPSPCSATCIAIDDDAVQCTTPHREDEPEVEFLPSLAIACYCRARVSENVDKLGLIDGISATLEEEGDMCTSFGEVFAIAQGMVVGAAMTVSVINVVLRIVLTMLARFEKHETITGEATAAVKMVFVAQFLNTAFVTLMVNAKLPGDLRSPLPGLLFNGDYDDFSSHWYSGVGFSVMFTVMVGAFAPHIGLVLAYFVINPFQRRLAVRKASSQQELEHFFRPPQFLIYERYPVTLAALFVGLSYSAGMPLLTVFVFTAFLVTYVLDKMFLYRHFAVPPRYDQELASMISHLVPYAIILHLALAGWMHGSPELEAHDLDSIRLLRQIAQFDVIGAVPRLQRATVMQLYEFGGVVLVWLLFGGLIKRAIYKLIYITTAGEFGYTDDNEVRENNSPFTAEFVETSGAADIEDGRSVTSADLLLGDEDSNSEAEDEAADDFDDDELSEWYTVKVLRDGRLRRGRVWKTRTVVNGVPRSEGQRLRTWEYIRSRTPYSYSYKRAVVPKCKAAVVVLTGNEETRCNLDVLAETFSTGPDLRESLFPKSRWKGNPLYGLAPMPKQPKKVEPSECRDIRADARDQEVRLMWTFPKHDGHTPLQSFTIVINVVDDDDKPEGTEFCRRKFEVVADEKTGQEPDKAISINPSCTKAAMRWAGLENGARLRFGVIATNLVGPSPVAWSDTVQPCGWPTGPLNVTSNPGDRHIIVNWDPPADTGGVPVREYTVLPSVDSIRKQVVPGDQRWARIDGLVNSKYRSYCFKVKCLNVRGKEGPWSEPSEPATCSTVPDPPRDPVAVRHDGYAMVRWSKPKSDQGADVDAYRVDTYTADGLVLVESAAPQYDIDDPLCAKVRSLRNGESVVFTVSAHNWRGWSAASPPTEETLPAGVPHQVQSVEGVVGDAVADIKWTTPGDNGEPITHITLIRRDVDAGERNDGSGEADDAFDDLPADATHKHVTGLRNGDHYQWWVTATNAVGTSQLSEATPLLQPIGVAGKPTDVTAVAAHAEATVRWLPPRYTGGCDITQWIVKPSRFPLRDVYVPATEREVLIRGLENGREYQFTVRAVNAAGVGPFSDPSPPVVPQMVKFKPSDVKHLLSVERRDRQDGKPMWWDGADGWDQSAERRGTADDPRLVHLGEVEGPVSQMVLESKLTAMFRDPEDVRRRLGGARTPTVEVTASNARRPQPMTVQLRAFAATPRWMPLFQRGPVKALI